MCVKYLTDITAEILTWCFPVDTELEEESIKYGLLYNWFAVNDPRYITSFGWHIPTLNDLTIFINYLGGESITGGKLKESGTTYWNNPNTNATNEVKYNGRGAGIRYSDGDYGYIKEYGILWSSTDDYPESDAGVLTLSLIYDTEECWLTYNSYPGPDGGNCKNNGLSVRPMKDSTILTHGQTGTYTGNDGKIYRTICIGTQEWVADNIAETEYRDGTAIPIVTDNTAWAALVTGAMCYYDNDINNA